MSGRDGTRISPELRTDGVSASGASGGSSDLRSDGGQFNRREVAYRLFAAEFEDADLEYSDSDEERAPNYVVTPTGARVNRLFVVGVLTEVEPVSDDVLRARVVDPTGAFVVYAGQYQPEAVAFLEDAEVPSFVAVTGKARTFRPEGGDRVFTSVRPETITAVDAETRDRWTVQAAEHTLARVATAAAALDREERGEALAAALRADGVEPGLAAGVALAIDHYGTTTGYLAAVRELALAAAEVVAGEREEVPPLEVAPDEGGAVEASLSAAPPVVGTLSGASAAQSPDEPAALASGASTAAAEASSEVASEPTGATEPEAEPSETGPGTPEPAAESTASEPEAAEPDATDTGASDATDDLGDFEDYGDESGEVAADAEGERYELDAAEREQVEAEFDTEFSTAGEVGEPGEAGIEPEAEPPSGPDAADEPAAGGADDEATSEPVDDSEVEAGATDEEAVADNQGAVDDDAVIDEEAATEEEAAAEEETADAAAAAGTDGSGAPAGDDVDLEDAVVETMAELDDGDGADREAVVAAIVEAHGVEVDVVEAAIRDALMDGRCYEPADGTLKAV